jgi:hypothetical protein
MQRILIVTLALACAASPAWAQITVTFEEIAKTGDPVPGRPFVDFWFDGRAFQDESPGVFSRPCINDLGDVVFRGQASTLGSSPVNSTGIYMKRGSGALELLVDNVPDDIDTAFQVPGRPTGTLFTGFRRPLINNRGDVLFHANISGVQEGLYVYRAADQQIIKIVDTLTEVPGFTGVVFDRGLSIFGDPRLLASMNDVGDVVFLGQFRRPSRSFDDQGYYGVNIDGLTPPGVPDVGGPIVRLVDSTTSISPEGDARTFWGISQNRPPAINIDGQVIFEARIGTSTANLRTGIFTIPVNGSSLAQIIAVQSQTSPTLSDGNTLTYSGDFGGHDINDAGEFLFQHRFADSSTALLTGDLTPPVNSLNVVVDSKGGFAVPDDSGILFTFVTIAPLNALGHIGFAALDNGPDAFAEGVFAADLFGSPFAKVARIGEVPPGQSIPATFDDFRNQGAAINVLGNMALAPTATTNATPDDGVFGLWFYSACTGTLDLVVDRDTSENALPIGLGDNYAAPGCFGDPCERDLRIFEGFETRAGHQRSINGNDDIAFLAAFSTFNVGIYVADILSSGGALSITCPPDVTIDCTDYDPDDASATGTAIATCAIGAPTFGDPADSASECTLGNTSITRTWKAIDAADNVVTCEQIITTVDVTPPTLTAPADVTIACDADTTPASTGLATAIDDCDEAPSISADDIITHVSCPGNYTITRSWTATDTCGNIASADQVITVQDVTAPVLTMPADTTISCDADFSPGSTGLASAEDDCDSEPAVTFDDTTTAGDCADEFVITRTWTATDNCGNATAADQLITVEDTTPPTVTVPLDMTIECDADSSPTGTGSATATDNCDDDPTVTANDSVAPGSCPTESVITRTWTATDACANTSSEAQVISVQDTTAPEITQPAADQTVECDGAGNTAALTTWLDTQGGALATDNCGGVTWTNDFTALSDDCGATGSATVNFTAADDCGNDSIQTPATFTIEDTTPPTLTVDSSEITVVDTDCSGQEPVTLPPATATDDCGDVTVTTDGPPEFPAGETTTVNVTATDDCGNNTTAPVNVSVKYGATIEVRAHSLQFSDGCFPTITKEPLVGITVHAYARPEYEHCSHYQTWWCGWHWWRHVVHECDESEPVNSAVTDENGIALIDVPPGDYIVISFFDFDGDGEVDHYLGRSARGVECGETLVRHLRLLITSDGTRIAARISRYTGSELLIAEPDMMIWDETEQKYPFGFESTGDWGVSVTVAPPEGFVSDHDELSEDVQDEIDAVQFTVTEVGSDLVPTQTSFVITHNGRRQVVNSNVGILLTPDYAESRGFNAEELRERGLIFDKKPTRSPLDRSGPEDRPSTGTDASDGKSETRTSVGSQ